MVTTLKNLDRPKQPAWHARFIRRNTTLKQIENQKSSLRYKRARYYSAQLGRFISRDPLGFVDGMSLCRAYFVPGGIDPFGKQQEGSEQENKLCEKYRKVFDEDLRKLKETSTYKELEKKGCIPVITFVCPGRGVGIHGSGEIIIDGGPPPYFETLVHELVHAYDACVTPDPPGHPCMILACEEIRAYGFEGICDKSVTCEQRANCLRDEAADSISAYWINTNGKGDCAPVTALTRINRLNDEARLWADRAIDKCFVCKTCRGPSQLPFPQDLF